MSDQETLYVRLPLKGGGGKSKKRGRKKLLPLRRESSCTLKPGNRNIKTIVTKRRSERLNLKRPCEVYEENPNGKTQHFRYAIQRSILRALQAVFAVVSVENCSTCHAQVYRMDGQVI